MHRQRNNTPMFDLQPVEIICITRYELPIKIVRNVRKSSVSLAGCYFFGPGPSQAAN